MSLPHNTRRLRDGRLIHGNLSTVFPDWRPDERWLIISPHDDDPPLAGGLLLAAAGRAGIPVRVRIVTDGRMGYTPHVSAAEVVARRREEARSSFTILNVADLRWYDYPDTRLHRWQGRIPAEIVTEPPHVVAGFTGIQNSVVAELREYRPTRIFVLSGNDYHPDHKVVHQETMMCIFHAQGDIWPELGPPIEERPWVHELAAYRPFRSEPDICLRGDDAMFREKLDAIAAFASQTQIAQLVASVQRAGAVEYLRSYRFETYDPAVYAPLFDSDE